MNNLLSLLRTEALLQGIDSGDIDDFILEIYGELFLGEGTRTYSPHSELIQGLDPQWVPGRSPLPFQGLRKIQIPRDRGRFFEGSEKDSSEPFLYVHPNTWSKKGLAYRDFLESWDYEILPFWPGGSHRSVLIKDGSSFRRVKLHLEDVQISRYYRNLGGRTIEHSVRVSQEVVQNWSSIRDLAGETFGFYPDIRGTVVKNPQGQRDGEWGSLERRLHPMGFSGEPIALPLYAFYGTPPGGGATLVESLIAQTGEDPQDFIFQRLMKPVIAGWIALFEATGAVWEPHGQNTVLLCNRKSLLPEGIAFRDADTLLSLDKRASLGLDSSLFFDRNLADQTPTEEMPLGDRSEISRVLDISMGRNTFSYLEALFIKEFRGAPGVLPELCRQVFVEKWPQRDRYLPRSVFGYRRDPLKRDRNCYPLVPQSGQSPLWRPSPKGG